MSAMYVHAFLAPFRGLRRMFQPGLRGLVFWPLLINVVLVGGLATAALLGFDGLLAAWLPQGWGWLQWLLWPLFAAALLLIVALTAVWIAALVASPFAGPLAYRAALLLGRRPAAPARSLAAETAHSLATAGRKIAYYALLLVPVLILSLIPGLNLLAPFAWFLFGSWVLAVEFLEAPLANDGQDFRAVRRTLARHRLTALAFGAGTMLLTLIPVLNLLVVPAAVVGATEVWGQEFSAGALEPQH
jgi:CysZ protein